MVERSRRPARILPSPIEPLWRFSTAGESDPSGAESYQTGPHPGVVSIGGKPPWIGVLDMQQEMIRLMHVKLYQTAIIYDNFVVHQRQSTHYVTDQ